MKITIVTGTPHAPPPIYIWEQIKNRVGVYKEHKGAEHLRYVTCRVGDALKTAVVNLSTNTISKPYAGNCSRGYIEAEPLTITFSND